MKGKNKKDYAFRQWLNKMSQGEVFWTSREVSNPQTLLLHGVKQCIKIAHSCLLCVCKGMLPDSACGSYQFEHHCSRKPAHLGAELVHPSAVKVDVQHEKAKTAHQGSATTRGKGRGFRIA